MEPEQEKAIALLKEGIELAISSGLRITCSVDISKDDDTALARCFGEFDEINSWPSDTGFGSNEIQINFTGSLNGVAIQTIKRGN